MSPYWVIAIIIFVLGCAGSYFARRHKAKIALAFAVLESKARAARDRQKAKDRKKAQRT